MRHRPCSTVVLCGIGMPVGGRFRFISRFIEEIRKVVMSVRVIAVDR